MLDDYEQLVRELDCLSDEFKCLRLSNVKGWLEVSRESIYCRTQIPKPSVASVRLLERKLSKVDFEYSISSAGLEVLPTRSRTKAEFSAPCWYMRQTGEAIVNSVGESLFSDGGWSSDITGELSGEHLHEAIGAIERADVWLRERKKFVVEAVFGRNLIIHGYGWPDVVLSIAEIGDATMTKPDWQVEIGCVEVVTKSDGSQRLRATNNRSRQRLSISIWEMRKEDEHRDFLLGVEPFRSVTEADELFIGDPPEVVSCKVEIKTLLRNSELACDWLRRWLETHSSRERKANAVESPNFVSSSGLPDTTPAFAKPKSAEIENAKNAIRAIATDLQLERDGRARIRADQLATKCHDSGHSKAASYWAIHEMICSRELNLQLLKWGGPIEANGFGGRRKLPSHSELPWNQPTNSTKRLAISDYSKFNVEWEPPSETAPQKYAQQFETLVNLRVLLNAHYHRRDHNGLSPVGDLYRAIEPRIEGLRIAMVKAGIIASCNSIRVKNYDSPSSKTDTDDLDRLVNKLIEIGEAKTTSEAWNLSIETTMDSIGSFQVKRQLNLPGVSSDDAAAILRDDTEPAKQIIVDCAIALIRDRAEHYKCWTSVNEVTHPEELAFKLLSKFGYVESRNDWSEVRFTTNGHYNSDLMKKQASHASAIGIVLYEASREFVEKSSHESCETVQPETAQTPTTAPRSESTHNGLGQSGKSAVEAERFRAKMLKHHFDRDGNLLYRAIDRQTLCH